MLTNYQSGLRGILPAMTLGVMAGMVFVHLCRSRSGQDHADCGLASEGRGSESRLMPGVATARLVRARPGLN